jgi:F plasmid transfer operon, TraF, protein
MRRASFPGIALLFILCSASAFAAQITEPAFLPLSPQVMGQGGSYIADAQGYDAFFYNPAGFSRSNGAFTLTSSSTWVYARPDLLISQIAQNLAGTQTSSSLLNFINSQATTGGIGIGSSLGIGYVGGGFGLGAVLIFDSSLYGPTLLGVTGDLTATLGFIGGFSLPFDLGGGRKIYVGADIRPMIRIHAPVSNSTSVAVLNALTSGGDIGSALSGAATVYGSAIGLDVGAMAELGWFSLGLSVRDLGGTQFNYSTNTFGAVTGSLASRLSLPSGRSVNDTYAIPMDVGFGLAFHPDLGPTSLFFDPLLSFDMNNIIGAIDGSADFWTLLHAGTEIRLMNLFTIRGGVNQGYLTLGAGLKVLIFDMNMAIFSQELGAHIGDRPAAGMTFSLDCRI